jgi:hypothetical protein
MTEAQDWVTFLLALAGLLGVLITHFRWVRPRYRRWRSQFIAARDSIIGRPAELDTITGREIAPALPGVGMRLATTEEHLGKLASAVSELVHERAAREALAHRVTVVEDKVETLEAASVERVVNRVDSAHAWAAVAEAIKAQPDVVVEPDRPDPPQ